MQTVELDKLPFIISVPHLARLFVFIDCCLITCVDTETCINGTTIYEMESYHFKYLMNMQYNHKY